MATLIAHPSPAKQPKTTTGERQEGELLALFMLLTVNFGAVMYISWGDMEFLESAGVTYAGLALLLVRIFDCWEPITDGGRRCLDAAICFFVLSLPVIQVPRLARAVASSTTASVPTMLVAVAGVAALGVGGCCAYLIHRRTSSWSKQRRHEAIFLPLRQEPHS